MDFKPCSGLGRWRRGTCLKVRSNVCRPCEKHVFKRISLRSKSSSASPHGNPGCDCKGSRGTQAFFPNVCKRIGRWLSRNVLRRTYEEDVRIPIIEARDETSVMIVEDRSGAHPAGLTENSIESYGNDAPALPDWRALLIRRRDTA